MKALIAAACARMGYRISRFSSTPFVFNAKPSDLPGGDLGLAQNLARFARVVDLFYSGMAVPPPLEIGGAWRNDLMARRKIQSVIYREDASAIARFHEQMFFNELIYGLWNYGYVTKRRVCSVEAGRMFQSDLENYRHMFPSCPFLVSTIPLPAWGAGKEIIRFTDPWHALQANHLSDVATLVRTAAVPLSLVEVGSGFGGLAEKLLTAKMFEKVVLFDIPHNLMTAYYYLGRCLGEQAVSLVTSVDELHGADQDASRKALLAPTCFYEALRELKGAFIFGNFGSFSEMDLATIEFYLRGLPAETLAIVQGNSNKPVINAGHREVPCDAFPIPKHFQRVFGGQATDGLATGRRYKTTVHLKVPLGSNRT